MPKRWKMVLSVIKQTILTFFLNLEGHQNRCIGTKVTAILLNKWILPTGGATRGRVCACSLRSRLVFYFEPVNTLNVHMTLGPIKALCQVRSQFKQISFKGMAVLSYFPRSNLLWSLWSLIYLLLTYENPLCSSAKSNLTAFIWPRLGVMLVQLIWTCSVLWCF